jgi:hypothetical protein
LVLIRLPQDKKRKKTKKRKKKCHEPLITNLGQRSALIGLLFVCPGQKKKENQEKKKKSLQSKGLGKGPLGYIAAK